MSDFDAELRQEALDAITEFGKTIVITSTIPGAYNNATQTTGSPTTLTQTPKAIVEDFDGDSFDGNLVQAGDKKLTVAAQGLTKPQPGDFITLDGESFTIVEKGVRTVYSGELPCLYIIQGHN